MRETYRDPVFNLKAVVEETGVTADTLRAWERRYELPQPARTDGGHRIYSQRDIDVIKWLVARQEEGLRIGRAVKLYRNLEKEGQEPLMAMPSKSETTAVTGDAIAELRQAWVSASLSFDERGAEQVVTRAFALYPPELVCLEVLRAGIVEIGQRWYEGDATVQQEHFASELAMRRLESLIRAAPPPTRPGHILTACPPGEEHVIGLTILAFLLRRAGWDVLHLGANVPQRRMRETIRTVRPRLVILAAQQLHTAASLLRMAQSLRQEGIPLAFGGGIFNRLPLLQDRIPASFLGTSLEEASEAVERMMTRPPSRPPLVETPSRIHEQALGHYCDQRLSLETQVWEILRAIGVDYETLVETNAQLGRAITGALAFGNVALLDSYMTWLEGMGNGIGVSADALTSYMKAYHQAAEAHLDERGAPILDWLSERIDAEAEREQGDRG